MSSQSNVSKYERPSHCFSGVRSIPRGDQIAISKIRKAYRAVYARRGMKPPPTSREFVMFTYHEEIGKERCFRAL